MRIRHLVSWITVAGVGLAALLFQILSSEPPRIFQQIFGTQNSPRKAILPSTLSLRQLPGNQFSELPLYPKNIFDKSANEDRTSKVSDDEEACWKKVESQFLPNEFIDYSRTHWNDSIGGWYFANNIEHAVAPQVSVAGRFLYGLARAGLLDGKEIERNDQEALEELAEVSAVDPTNAAPWLYAAIVEARGGNTRQASRFLKLALSTTRFDSYLHEVTTAIFERVKTEGDLVEAVAVWSRSPIPNYTVIREFVRGQMGAEKIGLMMMNDGLNPDRLVSDLDWFPIEYAIGKKILDDVGSKGRYPDHQSLLHIKAQRSPISLDQSWRALRENCNIRSLAPIVGEIQKHLSDHRQTQ
ncbi:MAG: tetratricopeptide repeat protein [Bdellovibrionaceae bacterium]|nr:tetratricopeptide repeat protein [Pseudobdellovibrionaceae bacterium]